jgi:hypothetical protein
MQHYYCEADPDSLPRIEAGLADGSIEFWRCDLHGRRWYRTLPAIRGVPREPARPIVADDDDDDCLFVDADGEQHAASAPPMRAIDPDASFVRFDQ